MKLLISSVLVVYLWACAEAQSDTSSEIPRIPSVPSLPEIPSLNNVLPSGTTNPLSNINTNLNSLTNGLSNSLPNNPLNGLQQGLSNSLPNNPMNGLQQGLSNSLTNNPLNGLQQGLSNSLPNSPLNGLQNSVIPSGQQSGMGGLFGNIMNSITRPLVDIGPSRVSDQGRHIGVNVPFIYSLDMDTRGQPGQSRLTSNTMMGLVRVDRDRVRGPDGKLTGPVQVCL